MNRDLTSSPVDRQNILNTQNGYVAVSVKRLQERKLAISSVDVPETDFGNMVGVLFKEWLWQTSSTDQAIIVRAAVSV